MSSTTAPREEQAYAHAPFPIHLVQVNRGQEDRGDVNREKSTWIGTPYAAHFVENSYSASALVWPQNMCSCMQHIWHTAVCLLFGYGHPTVCRFLIGMY